MVATNLLDEPAHDALDHTGLTGVGSAPEIDYVEKTTATTITGTNEAGGTTIVSSASLAYDGSTDVDIEVFIPYIHLVSSSGAVICVVDLWEDSTPLGRLAEFASGATSASWRAPMHASRRLTPSAASHQYHVKAWKELGGTTTVAANAGAGGTGTLMPAFIKIKPA